jgi:subtilisin family serine protease
MTRRQLLGATVAALTLTLSADSGLAASSVRSVQPVQMESVDPLTRPAPVLRRALVLAEDSARPEEKITAGLWARLAKSALDDEIAIIVELRQPLHRSGAAAAAAYSPAWDAEQVELSAAVEHRFAARAAGLLHGMRGLSHVPMVIGRAARRDLERIAALPEVHRIYEDEVLTTARVEGGALIRADTLRTASGGTGAGVTVAVLDTGIDADHPEVAGRVVAQADFTGTTGNGTVDDNGHGTAVAGILAGTGGMAPQATLWAFKVLNAAGTSVGSSVLSGLNTAFANRAQFGGLDVLNMSLADANSFASHCDGASAFNSILNALAGAGVAVFVASGNSGFAGGISHPACHSQVLAVGAVYDVSLGPRGPFPNAGNCSNPTTAPDTIACYSNSGPPLDLLAPSDCARTIMPGNRTVDCFRGTSAATPYAAGVAAQLLSLRPGTPLAALRQALTTTGKPLTGTNGVTRNRIDAVAAFQALGGPGDTSPCLRDADTACLVGGRFEVEVGWQTATATGAAQVMDFAGERAENAESAFFWFFNPTNFEMGLKILDACSINNRFWVFVSGLTDQAWTVRLRDTQTGATKSYTNPLGRITATTADTGALSCP